MRRPNIRPFVEELESCLEGESWEVIFVDDDSSDDTQQIVAAFALKNEPIYVYWSEWGGMG